MTLARHQDPIIAIATATGRGAVGIIRISGKGLGPLAQAICGKELKAREATYLPFRDERGETIDRGLALFFQAPYSFTGEDVLELQAHGGSVVLQLLLAHCLAVAHSLPQQESPFGFNRLRVAKPGEFSERAFLNGKLDLAQAEAIADLIDAGTEQAARSASRSLAGEFSKEIHALQETLVQLRMLVEATLDFPEEEIDFLQQANARGRLLKLKQDVVLVQCKARQGALLREGIKVVIAGQPNAGKSSLLNALAGVDLAIVTPIAGTTRDKVQQTIQIEGIPLHVIDTAGLRESQDDVEKIGIDRAWIEILGADAVLFLHDLTQIQNADYLAADRHIAQKLDVNLPKTVPVLDVWNKVDVAGNGSSNSGVPMSAKTGVGLDNLRQKLLMIAGWQSMPEGVFLARERHVQALSRVLMHLDYADKHISISIPALDLLAEELRLAQNNLGEITGEFSSDDLLGVIFSQFCIGK